MKYIVTYGGLGDCVMLCEEIHDQDAIHVFTTRSNADLIEALGLRIRVTVKKFKVSESFFSKIVLFLNVYMVCVWLLLSGRAKTVGICSFNQAFSRLSFNKIKPMDVSLSNTDRAVCYRKFMEDLC